MSIIQLLRLSFANNLNWLGFDQLCIDTPWSAFDVKLYTRSTELWRAL